MALPSARTSCPKDELGANESGQVTASSQPWPPHQLLCTLHYFFSLGSRPKLIFTEVARAHFIQCPQGEEAQREDAVSRRGCGLLTPQCPATSHTLSHKGKTSNSDAPAFECQVTSYVSLGTLFNLNAFNYKSDNDSVCLVIKG
jgi:hypothetical protein